jgi:hypothetical protein
MKATLIRRWDGKYLLWVFTARGRTLDEHEVDVQRPDAEGDVLAAATQTIYEVGMLPVGDWTEDEYGNPTIEVEQRAVRVSVGWDKQDPDNQGWAVEVYDVDGQILTSSGSVDFPIDVDEYDRDEEADLVEVLQEVYPGAKVEVRR